MDHIMTYEKYLRDVKKGIVTDLGNSPVTPLLLMLQGKWKTQILYELCIHDTVRFGTLKKELPGITNTMLTNSLRELERAGRLDFCFIGWLCRENFDFLFAGYEL